MSPSASQVYAPAGSFSSKRQNGKSLLGRTDVAGHSQPTSFCAARYRITLSLSSVPRVSGEILPIPPPAHMSASQATRPGRWESNGIIGHETVSHTTRYGSTAPVKSSCKGYVLTKATTPVPLRPLNRQRYTHKKTGTVWRSSILAENSGGRVRDVG